MASSRKRKIAQQPGLLAIALNRQRGSHMVLIRVGTPVNLSVPDHRELDRGLLRGLIRDSGMSVDEFRALL
jgi:predicted RNA binding protein YcfA (HicA-like mRNA interferase family)